jgi:cell division protein FtsA
MPSIRELAEDVFRAPVRLAKPAHVRGLGETFSSPAFSAAAGLLRWELMGGADASRFGPDRLALDAGGSMMKQVFGWVQNNF